MSKHILKIDYRFTSARDSWLVGTCLRVDIAMHQKDGPAREEQALMRHTVWSKLATLISKLNERREIRKYNNRCVTRQHPAG